MLNYRRFLSTALALEITELGNLEITHSSKKSYSGQWRQVVKLQEKNGDLFKVKDPRHFFCGRRHPSYYGRRWAIT